MTEQLPPELERRITAIESQAQGGEDFDSASWWWLIFLGVLLPIGMLLYGWFG